MRKRNEKLGLAVQLKRSIRDLSSSRQVGRVFSYTFVSHLLLIITVVIPAKRKRESYGRAFRSFDPGHRHLILLAWLPVDPIGFSLIITVVNPAN